jgi:hypothetical protein
VFARHLPPSAGRPRVLALDPATASELAPVADLTLAAPGGWPPGPFDAVAGQAAPEPETLQALRARLRPGGRLILAAAGAPDALLRALTESGLIHCLVEAAGDEPGAAAEGPGPALVLYRGERPPLGSSLDRTQSLAREASPAGRSALPVIDHQALPPTPFLHLLITQTPNKPVWRLAPGEGVTWHAATLVEPASGRPALLVFSALVKAVAYMQRAVLAGQLAGINKVGKFPAAAAAGWPLKLIYNPAFEQAQAAAPGPALPVDPQLALTGEE